MWGKRKSAEEDPAAGAENAGAGKRAQRSAIDAGVTTGPRASEAIVSVRPALSRNTPPNARGDVVLNGASQPGAEGRLPEVPQAQAINGAAETPSAAPSNQTLQGPTPDEIRFAVTFTRIVSVLTRSPHYKHYTLGDLEWLVVPPILGGQCAVMEAKINDRQVPVAAALWASVSEEVDKRLLQNLTTAFKLRPDEWRSGDILWLIDAVGDAKSVALLLTQVQETIFKERPVKMRTRGPDSRPKVGLLKVAPPTS